MQESTWLINERIRERGKVLGNGRLGVIFCDESVDLRKIYKHGVENGNGSAEAREAREAPRVRLEDMSDVDERG
jgi:hypothetical protein